MDCSSSWPLGFDYVFFTYYVSTWGVCYQRSNRALREIRTILGGNGQYTDHRLCELIACFFVVKMSEKGDDAYEVMKIAIRENEGTEDHRRSCHNWYQV